MIDAELLRSFGASEKHLAKGEILFSEGQRAVYYYQVLGGEVKMNNYNQDGREFIQGIFRDGESFGEPPLFGDFTYPANCEAVTDTVVLRLDKARFFELLRANPEAHLNVTATLGQRLHYKAVIAAEMSHNPPEHRIYKLLLYLKHNVHHIGRGQPYEVELTRQQIGDLCGLRVETTIKAIKKLEEQGKVAIRNRKVFV